MMLRLLLISLLVGIISCGPLPSPQEENSDTSSQAIFSLFSQLASAVQKTGEVITKLSENYTEVPEIAEAGERISEAGETLPGEFNDIVQDNFQKLLELLPSVKHNITEAMNQLPGIRKTISENVAKLPSSETIKENVQTIFDVLPEHDLVDSIKNTIDEHVDKIPSNDYIDEQIQRALDQIPSADIVNSRVDEFVDQISPVVEQLNETGGRK